MNRLTKGMAAVMVIGMLAGNAFAVSHEGRDHGPRDGGYQQVAVKAVKRIVRALGDFLTVPRP